LLQAVPPLDRPYLHFGTLGTVVLGCTGMILFTGAMVQVFTSFQIKQLLGLNRVKTDIDKLKDHVIVCGFGRIGFMLAKDLASGGLPFVILELRDKRFQEALDLDYLAMQVDATDETALIAAGVRQAKVLATVLPDDAANVFITLSARSLNPHLHIIARGEVPSTESKLIQAGADQVVLPTRARGERKGLGAGGGRSSSCRSIGAAASPSRAPPRRPGSPPATAYWWSAASAGR
jgi:voltage-gated potassium channel Kch